MNAALALVEGQIVVAAAQVRAVHHVLAVPASLCYNY
jgi:hypothetical protein